MTRRQYSGGAARTTITGSIGSSGGGSVILTDATGWPDGSVGPFYVVVDAGTSAEEKILMDSRVGTTLTFSTDGRGADGTVATSHSAGADIAHCLTAIDVDEPNQHLNAASDAHTATQITFAPTGTIAATNVQTALAELATDATLVNAENRLIALELTDVDHDATLDTIQADNWVTGNRMATAKLTRTTALAISSTPAYIEWEAEASDPDALTSFVTSTVTVAKAGTYVVGGTFTIAGTFGSPLTIWMTKDVVGHVSNCAVGLNAGATKATFGIVNYFDAGDTFKIGIAVASLSATASAFSIELTRFSA